MLKPDWPFVAGLVTLVVTGCMVDHRTTSNTGVVPSGEQPPKVSQQQPTSTAAKAGVQVSGGAIAPYFIGTPVLTDLWVNPKTGHDNSDGRSEQTALKSITAAWNKIPKDLRSAATGFRIRLLPGVYPCEPGSKNNCVNYFADKVGTFAYPVWLSAEKGAGTVTIEGGLNIKGVSYLYLENIKLEGGGKLPTNSSGNNLLHFEDSHYVLLKNMHLRGPSCVTDTCNNLQEVLKVNQSTHMYVEDCTIAGANHTAVDYMVVQHGHMLNTHLADAGQWCMYVKGGSAHLHLESNELAGCRLGFQAGQSSNLVVMEPPYLHYEAYDIHFVGNVIHDIPGVPLSVAGGYNILYAYNTLVRVGTDGQGYPLFQVEHGERGCLVTDEQPSAKKACEERLMLGGYGTAQLIDPQPVIPSKHVWLYNNVFYNPSGFHTAYTHFSVRAPIKVKQEFRNISSPSAVDIDLVMKGNIVWNGPPTHPLGLGEPDTGCSNAHATCSPEQVKRNNLINTIEPQFEDVTKNKFRPRTGAAAANQRAIDIPQFLWDDSPLTPAIPKGKLLNQPPRVQTSALHPGALLDGG